MTDTWVAASSLLARIFRLLDRGDYAGLVACFTEQGSWTRQGKTDTGAGQILGGLNARPLTVSSLHLVQNVFVEEAADSTAFINFVLLVYRQDSPKPPPYPPPQPTAIGECTARLYRVGEVWRIGDLRTGPYLFVSK